MSLSSSAPLALSFLLLCAGARAQTAQDFFNPELLHEVRFYMHPSDWTTLKKNFLDNTYYPADFEWSFQGRQIALSGVRIRSRGTGSRSDTKPGLRVDIDRDEPGRRFLGLKSFVLRNNTQDATMIHERLGMHFFRRLGIEAPREAHARMYVNDEYAGLYTIVENVDKAFLRENFGEDDGYLYKYEYEAQDLPYYFEYRGADPGLYSPKPFQPETHELDPDARPLEAMIRAINQSSDAAFVAEVSEYLDLKRFLSHVAAERFIAEQDGVVGAYGMNNFYLYRFEKGNVSRLIPWDKSHAFYGGPEESIWRFVTDVPAAQENRLMRRALEVPELRAAYLSTLARSASIAGGESGYLLREIDRQYNQIRQAAREDRNKQCLDSQGRPALCSNEQFEAAIETMKDFARRRSMKVTEELAAYLDSSSERTFAITGRGGVSWTTLGASSSPAAGYGRIEPSAGALPAAGLAIFGFRQNDVLVTETGVPLTALLKGGRIHAEVDGAVSTGLAIANSNAEPATVSFYFTDADGKDYGHGATTIEARSQIARFLNELPFGGAVPLHGSFSFTSSIPVAALALRTLVNERSESLVSTLPVAELSEPSSEPRTLPHFADGGEWTTQIVLLNPTDSSLSGTVEFLAQGSAGTPAGPAAVTISGVTSSSFAYNLPARSSRSLKTAGDSDQVRSGSVRIVPKEGSPSPVASAIFSFRKAGTTVAEAGVSGAEKDTGFRMYAEVLGTPGETGAIETGLAIANPGESAVAVELELTDMSGNSKAIDKSISIPARGQIAKFLSQIDGFRSLKAPFQGILRITTSSVGGISAVGLRGRYNERGDFLITTTPPVGDRVAAGLTGETYVPHWVEGGGYTTQFVLWGAGLGVSTSGTLRTLSQDGKPLPVSLW